MAKQALTPRRKDTQLQMKTFEHENGHTYLVFRRGNSFHVFREVQAKESINDLSPLKEGEWRPQAERWAEYWEKN